MTINSEEVIALLGLAHNDAGVRQILEKFGLGAAKLKLKRGEADLNLEAIKFGAELIFSDPTLYDAPSSFPEGGLIFSGALLMSEGHEGYKQFSGKLPDDLRFQMSRQETRNLLGAPEWINPHLPLDRWAKGAFRLAVSYNTDEKSIKRLSVSIPKRP